MSNEDKTILVVDDELGILKLTKTVLESRGYKVMATDDVVEAISLYQANHSRINAVLLDMKMPAMSGIEVYQKMKTIDSNINAVVMSGYCNETPEYILSLGVKAFVKKPWGIEDLVSAIDEIVND